MSKTFAWGAFIFGILFFAVPLLGLFEFSLSMRRGVYSFDAYASVLSDPKFRQTFLYSVGAAIATIFVGVFIVVPTAYWVRLRMPGLRPYVEFITLLPLVIPAIVIVFGYIRLYGSNSWLPFLAETWSTSLLMVFGFTVLSLPYMYRSVDTGMRMIDVKTLTEAAQILGSGWGTILFRIILPNVLISVLSGAFLTFAIVIGEFIFPALLNLPAFGPYMQNVGANKAYEPMALAVIAFGITWGCMGLINLVARSQKHLQAKR